MDEIYHLHSLLFKSEESFLFRGQSNYEWDLNSSLYRKHSSVINNFTQTNEKNNKLDTSSFIEFSIDNTKKISKMQNEKNILRLWSKSQHDGLNTALIDFTSEFKHALWFAINDGDSLYDRCSIFIMQKQNSFYNIKNYEEVIMGRHIYICPHDITRGKSQKSFFIIQNSNTILKDYKIIKININLNKEINQLSLGQHIKFKYKIELRDSIQKFLNKENVKYETIYSDSKGINEKYYKSYENYRIMEGFYYQNKQNYLKELVPYLKLYYINPYNSFNLIRIGWALSKLKKSKILEPYTKNKQSSNKKFDDELTKTIVNKFEEAIKINPNEAEHYYEFGMYLKKNKEFGEKTLNIFEKAVQLDPKKTTYRLGQSFILFQIATNKENKMSYYFFKRSLEELENIIKIEPNNLYAYNNLIWCSKNLESILIKKTSKKSNKNIKEVVLKKIIEAIYHFENTYKYLWESSKHIIIKNIHNKKYKDSLIALLDLMSNFITINKVGQKQNVKEKNLKLLNDCKKELENNEIKIEFLEKNIKEIQIFFKDIYYSIKKLIETEYLF